MYVLEIRNQGQLFFFINVEVILGLHYTSSTSTTLDFDSISSIIFAGLVKSFRPYGNRESDSVNIIVHPRYLTQRGVSFTAVLAAEIR